MCDLVQITDAFRARVCSLFYQSKAGVLRIRISKVEGKLCVSDSLWEIPMISQVQPSLT